MTSNVPVLAAHTPVIPQAYLHPGLSLQQLVAILYGHRRHMLMILLGMLVAAQLVNWLVPKNYKATATLMVNFDVNDPLGGKEFPTGLMSNYLSTQRDLIQSPAVLLPVVDQLQLTENREYIAGYQKGAGDLRNWAMTRLGKDLQVEIGNYGSQLLYVTTSASSAAGAATLANSIAHVYTDQQLHRVNDPAGERAQRYGTQLEELKRNVDQAQADVTAFRQRTGLVEFNSKVNPVEERVADLEHRLLEAQEMRRIAEMHSTRSAALDSTALSSTTVQSLKSELAAKRSRLAELQQTLGPNHPDILQLQSQIASSQGALGAELGTYAGSARSDYQGAQRLEHQLQDELNQERAKLLDSRKVQDEGARYVRALEGAQTLYQRALDGYDQILLASGGRYSNVSFVAEAVPPARASWPKPLLNLILALLFGAVVAVAGPLGYELLNRRVRCRDDIERELGLPVLIELGQPTFPGSVT